MNEVNGLSSLTTNSIDLCLTDPPFNVNFKTLSNTKKKIYNDKIESYKEWCEDWFKQLKRICNTIIFTPGNNNLDLWFEIEKPKDLLFHYKPNAQGMTSISNTNKIDIYLYYGKSPKKRFQSNTYNIFIYNGFLRKKKFNLIHPSPKSFNLYFQIISQLGPKSVIDPFMGSGTTAEVCTKLGIPWFGYEINEVYSQDINKRLKNCKKEPQQVSLFEFIEKHSTREYHTLMDFIEV